MSTARKKSNSKSETVRLQVLLARCGLGSRRACEDYITAGRVTIDGEPATELGAKVDIAKQKVAVDGELIRPERTVCYMVNKPKGMLCTNSDPSGRARVVDLFPKSAGRLFPVGRLDENSVGLLLVTNDGDLSHRLAHPRFKVPKIYEVQVAGRPSREIMQQLRQGMYFSDGRFKVDNATITGSRGKSTILEVTLSEGRNREIRRLFSRVGHKVMKLERVAFGPLKLRSVGTGKFRVLTREEMSLLDDYIENGERRVKAAVEAAREKDSREDSKPARPVRSEAGSRKIQRESSRRVVEIGPVSSVAGHDLTGRKRSIKQPVDKRAGVQPVDKRAGVQPVDKRAGGRPVDKRAGGRPVDKRAGGRPVDKRVGGRLHDDDDDESINLSAHPAIVAKQLQPSPDQKLLTRKKAVRRPVAVGPESKGRGGGRPSGSGESDSSKRSTETKKDDGKVTRGKSMSRKKEAKAKQAGKRRKRR
jgi:23S rRNA pseudouridine2605 synthase